MQAQVSFQDRLAEAVLLDRGVQKQITRASVGSRHGRAAVYGLLAEVLRVSATVPRPRQVGSRRS